jgi:hypothetical protein
VVPPCSDRIARVPPYSSLLLFDAYGTVTRYGRPFQIVRFYITRALAWSGFARHYYRSHYTFQQPTNLKILTSQANTLLSGSYGMQPHPCSSSCSLNWKAVKVGCPIQKYADQRVLAPPRILSQLATSFFASYRQGIRQKPFNA